MKVNAMDCISNYCASNSCWIIPHIKVTPKPDYIINCKPSGDGKSKPSAGNFLQLKITYKTIKDSVFLIPIHVTKQDGYFTF